MYVIKILCLTTAGHIDNNDFVLSTMGQQQKTNKKPTQLRTMQCLFPHHFLFLSFQKSICIYWVPSGPSSLPYLVPHCLDLDLNGLLTRRNFCRIPGLLGNDTIPKWKEFLKCHFRIFKNCQNGTFLPMRENQNIFGPNVFIWCSKQ